MDPSPSKCSHFNRNCLIICPHCPIKQNLFGCHHCHKEAMSKQMGQKTYHELNKKDVEELFCLNCEKVCPKAEKCPNCGIQFGEKYTCLECSIFENEADDIFHCDDCGTCRRGGRDKYYHCKTCCACVPNSLKEVHTCIENVLKQNCPLCLEDLHSSSRQVFFLPKCNHPVHVDCQQDYICKTNPFYKPCAICRKPNIGNEEMEYYDKVFTDFRKNMFPEKEILRPIDCPNCNKRSEVPYNPVSLRCECGYHCLSAELLAGYTSTANLFSNMEEEQENS